ncbi:MAG: DnaD domain protein [Clostridia bacterium]|nr:DnaD domain protein [Clostridia bacterium]
MKLNFQQDVLVLPGAVLNHCGGADAANLRVLLWLASDLSLYSKHKQLAKLADCDVKAVKEALRFWQECGVLAEAEEAVPTMASVPVAAVQKLAEKPPKKTVLRRADELPNYTSVELAEMMEKRASVRILINEAQQILGKMFNPSEVNVMIGMLDYLGMSEECVLLLLAHCKRIGKTNLRAIEKYAITMSDKGISDSDAMEEEIRHAEAMHEFEGQVRALFGMKSRALTGKESKMLSAWLSYGYGIEVVRMAYEITVNATNEPSVAYANAILERWNSENLKTAEQITARMEEERAQKEGKKAEKSELGNSFDTDDFFEAALRRGFRERRED